MYHYSLIINKDGYVTHDSVDISYPVSKGENIKFNDDLYEIANVIHEMNGSTVLCCKFIEPTFLTFKQINK